MCALHPHILNFVCVDQQPSGCATFLLVPAVGPHPHVLQLPGVSPRRWVDELDRVIHCQITEVADHVIGTPQIRHDSRSWSHASARHGNHESLLGVAVDTTKHLLQYNTIKLISIKLISTFIHVSNYYTFNI